ncbi:MAG: diguanylate cyclase [Alphaproteobacteria bacterium]|nr:diguanylate cyclase [Alphaproteobacteria bacterium]
MQIPVGSDLAELIGTISCLSDEAMCLYDADDRIAWWNPRYPELFPEVGEMIAVGVHFLDTFERLFRLMAPDGDETAWAMYRANALERHRNVTGPLDYQRPDGRWIRMRMSRLSNGGRIKLWRDITHVYQGVTSDTRLSEVLASLRAGVVITERDGSILFGNGHYFIELVGRHVVDWSAFGRPDGRKLFWQALGLGLKPDPTVDQLLASPPIDQPLGQPLVVETQNGLFLRLEERRTDFGIVTLLVDVTELKRQEAAAAAAQAALIEANRRLAVQAATDALTGLLNRRKFSELAAEEMERARRYGRPLSLLALDLDHFKTVNDRFGHPVGDGVLRHVAEIIAAGVRSCDRVARLGGEEFAVLLPETRPADAMILAERLRRAVSGRPAEIPPAGAIQVTVSVGCVGLTREDETIETVMARADRALYVAKAAGRDCVVDG